MPAKFPDIDRVYRTARHLLHPLRVFYAQQKIRVLPFLLPFRELVGWVVNVPTPAGKVRLVPRGSTAITVMASGRYEPEVMEYLVQSMRSEDVFLDIGANAGVFTLAVARARPQSRIYAFEPAGETFALLQKNVAINKLTNVHAVRAALSDRDGEAALSINGPNRDALNTLLTPSQLPLAHAPSATATTETVPAMRLDSFLGRENVGPVGVVKVDVEGAEALVLQGAARLLAQSPSPVIVFEYWADHDQSAVRLLTELGYNVCDLTDDMKVATKTQGHQT